jgi:plasmid stabilization system protein ParE
MHSDDLRANVFATAPNFWFDGARVSPILERPALTDFDDIYDYIARDNPRAAAQVLRSLDESDQLKMASLCPPRQRRFAGTNGSRFKLRGSRWRYHSMT